MQTVVAIADIREHVRAAKGAGRRVAFVPTMGFLHEGHAALVTEARRRGDFVVMSVFVNPLQFGPSEDFAQYPRDAARDQRVAAESGVDVLWTPEAGEIYPTGPSIMVDPGPVGTILEGAIRPGHFAGVLTVVLKLFAIVQPEVAVFGRKDAQQAFLVRRMTEEFNLPVGIVVVPTVREHDGLALSSRNVYLDPAMREAAAALPRALEAGVAAFRAGERKAGSVVAASYRALANVAALTVEYINVLDPAEFQPNHAATPRSYLVLAARAGSRRLIDNVILGDGLESDPRLPARASDAAAVG